MSDLPYPFQSLWKLSDLTLLTVLRLSPLHEVGTQKGKVPGGAAETRLASWDAGPGGAWTGRDEA